MKAQYFCKAVFFSTLLTTGTTSVNSQSLDVGGALKSVQGEFDRAKDNRDDIREQNAQEAARRAAEAARNRDRSKDVCYQLPSGSDAQIACFGDHVMAIRDDRARNIMLGNCLVLGGSDFSNDLGYICQNGKTACSILSNGTAAYNCETCGASRRWLAVYSLGHTIQCFK